MSTVHTCPLSGASLDAPGASLDTKQNLVSNYRINQLFHRKYKSEWFIELLIMYNIYFLLKHVVMFLKKLKFNTEKEYNT